jgi:hypothetical protein
VEDEENEEASLEETSELWALSLPPVATDEESESLEEAFCTMHPVVRNAIATTKEKT